jgi:hypothetical protein
LGHSKQCATILQGLLYLPGNDAQQENILEHLKKLFDQFFKFMQSYTPKHVGRYGISYCGGSHFYEYSLSDLIQSETAVVPVASAADSDVKLAAPPAPAPMAAAAVAATAASTGSPAYSSGVVVPACNRPAAPGPDMELQTLRASTAAPLASTPMQAPF